jgi:hypothetical protein
MGTSRIYSFQIADRNITLTDVNTNQKTNDDKVVVLAGDQTEFQGSYQEFVSYYGLSQFVAENTDQFISHLKGFDEKLLDETSAYFVDANLETTSIWDHLRKRVSDLNHLNTLHAYDHSDRKEENIQHFLRSIQKVEPDFSISSSGYNIDLAGIRTYLKSSPNTQDPIYQFLTSDAMFDRIDENITINNDLNQEIKAYGELYDDIKSLVEVDTKEDLENLINRHPRISSLKEIGSSFRSKSPISYINLFKETNLYTIGLKLDQIIFLADHYPVLKGQKEKLIRLRAVLSSLKDTEPSPRNVVEFMNKVLGIKMNEFLDSEFQLGIFDDQYWEKVDQLNQILSGLEVNYYRETAYDKTKVFLTLPLYAEDLPDLDQSEKIAYLQENLGNIIAALYRHSEEDASSHTFFTQSLYQEMIGSQYVAKKYSNLASLIRSILRVYQTHPELFEGEHLVIQGESIDQNFSLGEGLPNVLDHLLNFYPELKKDY